MKNRRLVLSLLILMMLSLVNVNADLGPGIDINSSITFVKAGRGAYSVYITDEIRIVFNSGNASGDYTFFIGFGAYENPNGTVEFYLSTTSGKLASKTIVFNGSNIEFHTEYLFTASISQNTQYILGVKMLEGFWGTLYFLGYQRDRDPSASYYREPYSGKYYEIDYDIGWRAIPGSSGYNPPEFTVVSITTADRAYVDVSLKNFSPNSEVKIAYVDTSIQGSEPYREYVTTVKTDQNGSYHGTIVLTKFKQDDYLIAAGYDVLGNYVQVMSQRFNSTFVSPGWMDILVSWFNALMAYVKFAFDVIVALIPYAGLFYLLTFIGICVKCINESSITPLFDFFYRQYMMLVNISQLLIKIAEIIYQGSKTLIDYIIKLVDIVF